MGCRYFSLVLVVNITKTAFFLVFKVVNVIFMISNIVMQNDAFTVLFFRIKFLQNDIRIAVFKKFTHFIGPRYVFAFVKIEFVLSIFINIFFKLKFRIHLHSEFSLLFVNLF